MVKLNWNGKNESKKEFLKNHISFPFQIIETHQTSRKKSNNLKLMEKRENLLIWGDNKLIMSSLLADYAGKIRLIYIDPPFATGGDFNFKILIGENNNSIDELAYNDKWKKGLDYYLNFIYNRLILMKELLAKNGSIYIHIDWHIK
ncbi:unnamed protein product [marine sediment metagenome]|uniref:DNA methylase N-4/N-6 domain-containing protein n=1 Tax=marine sediment metagenome TaxID=412755 RepID=X1NKS7_9ZZZZ